nr:MAG TPA: hypothetical protein [Caudoviricetes sp.]
MKVTSHIFITSLRCNYRTRREAITQYSVFKLRR